MRVKVVVQVVGGIINDVEVYKGWDKANAKLAEWEKEMRPDYDDVKAFETEVK